MSPTPVPRLRASSRASGGTSYAAAAYVQVQDHSPPHVPAISQIDQHHDCACTVCHPHSSVPRRRRPTQRCSALVSAPGSYPARVMRPRLMLQPPAPKKGVSGLLTQKQTLPGGGAPEVGDLHLVEDGSERSGALVANGIARETESEGQSTGIVRKQACHGVYEEGEEGPLAGLMVEAHPRLVIFVSLRTAASAEALSTPILLPPRL